MLGSVGVRGHLALSALLVAWRTVDAVTTFSPVTENDETGTADICGST